MENKLNLDVSSDETGATTLLMNARKYARSREQLGVLLMDQILNLAATGKHFRADGVAEISLTVTVSLIKPATESDTETCHRVCWSSFGHEWLCLIECNTTHVM
jgi:hypothetical protein